jgi:hypothetical protein
MDASVLLWKKWHEQVKQIFGTMHGHQKKTLALVVLGIIEAGSAVLQRIAESVQLAGISACTGYLDHPFKNKPYKTGKDLLHNLQTEADWCTIRRRHQHPHARTTILSRDGEAS